MAITLDTFWSKVVSRKKVGESRKDYTRGFKESTEILKYHLEGPLILDKYANTIEGYI